MDEIDRMFEDGEPGTTLQLVISRDGRTREIRIKLKDLI
jgi:hypothetical protein